MKHKFGWIFMLFPHLIHITCGVFCNYWVKYHLYFGGSFEILHNTLSSRPISLRRGQNAVQEADQRVKSRISVVSIGTRKRLLQDRLSSSALSWSHEASAVLWHCSRGDQDKRQEEGGNKINPNKIYLQPQEQCRGYRPGLGLRAVVLP